MQIKFDPANPADIEAVQKILALLDHVPVEAINAAPEAPAPTAEPAAPAPAKRGRKPKAAAEPVVAEEVVEPVVAKPTAQASYTIDDVRAALQQYTAAHGVTGGIALLKSFHASRISELPAASYAEFIGQCQP